MAKKIANYCNLENFLNANGPELVHLRELFEQTCALGALHLGNKIGITLIIPTDATIGEVEKKLYAPSVEEGEEEDACNLLFSHVLRDVFRAPSDFVSKKDTVINALSDAQLLKVAKTSSSEVTFENGCVIVPDPRFPKSKDSSKGKRLSVWKVKSGAMPMKGTSAKPPRPRNTSVKTGQYEVTNEIASGLRYRIAIAAENAYVTHQLNKMAHKDLVYGGGSGPSNPNRDAFLEYSVSLLDYLNKVFPGGKALLIDRVLPFVSFHKFDFYVLVEPHGFVFGEPIIPDEAIQAWWEARLSRSFTLPTVKEEIRSLMQSAEAQSTGCALYTGRQEVLDAICAAAEILRDPGAGSVRQNAVPAVIELYKTACSDNKIGSVEKVFPDGTAALLSARPNAKLVLDETRFVSFSQFCKLDREPAFDTGAFRVATDYIADRLFYTAKGEGTAYILFNPNIKLQIMPHGKLEEIACFIYSSQFLYVPTLRGEWAIVHKKLSKERPRSKKVFFDVEGKLDARHNRLLVRGAAPEAHIKTALAALKKGEIEPELQELINSLSTGQ